MTNLDIENSRYYKYLMSDANIYLAIYSVESYVFEYELLSKEDKIIYQRMKDKFNEQFILEVIIPKVRAEIKRLVHNKEEYIYAQVYFKPKKIENEKIEYRPLHVTDIISQIAIVSMLNLLVYEIPIMEEEENKGELRLSNLSRLIPGNFYGNRVSLSPEELFKPWKQQYQEYTGLTNECLKKYHASLEYKYEVTLDLENFFPSVNPRFIYAYIVNKLPVNLAANDRMLFEIILLKLLYCKVDNLDSEELWGKYYFKDKNNDIEKWGQRFECFVKGIPQGLPQSYFLGNIAMIEISKLFIKKFPGISMFYVDDSVIFTNAVIEDEFQESLQELNEEIGKMISEVLNENAALNLPEPLVEMEKYCEVNVYKQGKSYYTRLDQADSGEIFLMYLSRESSHAAADIYRLYSDEEDTILKERMGILSEVVENKIKDLTDKLEKNELSQGDRDRYKKFKDRLIRYYKFFRYRFTILDLMETEDIKELEKIIFGSEYEENNLKGFMDSYKDGIWSVAVSLYKKQTTDEKKLRKLKNFIKKINLALFENDNKTSSYIYKTNIDLFDKNEQIDIQDITPYDSLKAIAAKKLKNYAGKHYIVIESYISDLNTMSRDEIIRKIVSVRFYECIKVVNNNTEKLYRMILNSIYSSLFTVEIEDNFVISKKNRKSLTYGELRILLFVRNPEFTEKDFKERNIILSEYANKLPIDYSVIEVTEAFRTFVKASVPIDKLVLTHQYTCDVWKNGSKFLYFYTLHNQEHAIDLIKNIIKIIHTFDFFQISSLDFYILFLSCYLHDIAMVKIPAYDSFLNDTEEADEIAYEVIEKMNLQKEETHSIIEEGDAFGDLVEIKSMLTQVYQKMDAFYENQIRAKHSVNSASEIRNVKELEYLEDCLREFVAEVAVAHGYSTEDIYFTKSNALSKKVSMKFNKILLRLADSLDISMYRVSKPILLHNLNQMPQQSAFHWISHLLTREYELKTSYEMRSKKEGEEVQDILSPKSITERVILEVSVEMTQLSQFSHSQKCPWVRIDKNTLRDDKQYFELVCGGECKEKDCNFLCRWFTAKNEYLLEELNALNQYLKRMPDNFFDSEIVVKIKMVESTKLDANQFEIIQKYLEEKERETK